MSKKDAEFEGFLRGLETARKTALEVEQDGGCVSDELNRMIRMRRSTGVTLGMTQKEFNRHIDALMEGSIDWHDIVACLEVETGVKLEFPKDLMQQKILC